MRLLLVLVLAAVLAAGCDRADPPPPVPSTAPPAAASGACAPSYEEPDALSPSYRPGAPVRAVVGQGHVLTGTVHSSRDCAPVAGARVELWPEIAGQGHPDGQRATVVTGADGGYRFQSDPPEHIHMLVAAEGFEPLASNRYHPEGGQRGRFDILLTPSPS
ncbi:MAG TPA: carboxypeptidase regulatory-like domain-containing protein [Actinomycetota bacterium]|nr:carboxypeptidase regulatory-like domain-containing protein [Actinomycetota bacterium]